VEKLEGKIPVGTYRLGWEDNIKMYSGEIGWCDKLVTSG
jgi:hypothetical protein